mmetsp:Transcript_40330/g.116476  ORF Transcript_40330/g.116476 Transcript_40330/m.116476 type:complete len:209 (-) Transcript_40330:56-682(-)
MQTRWMVLTLSRMRHSPSTHSRRTACSHRTCRSSYLCSAPSRRTQGWWPVWRQLAIIGGACAGELYSLVAPAAVLRWCSRRRSRLRSARSGATASCTGRISCTVCTLKAAMARSDRHVSRGCLHCRQSSLRASQRFCLGSLRRSMWPVDCCGSTGRPGWRLRRRSRGSQCCGRQLCCSWLARAGLGSASRKRPGRGDLARGPGAAAAA